MTSTPGPEKSERSKSFFDRLTEPFTDKAREKIEQVEDHVREAIQAEINAVASSVRTRAVEVRPSAIAFGIAALVTFFGLALFVTAAVMGLSHAVDPWLAAVIIGVALVLIGAGAAAWGRRHLPSGPPITVVRIHESTHPAEEQVHPWED
jgi:hypothetical protein